MTTRFEVLYPLAPASPVPTERPDVIAAFHDVASLERQAARYQRAITFANSLGQTGAAAVMRGALRRTEGRLAQARQVAAELSGRSLETDRLEDR